MKKPLLLFLGSLGMASGGMAQQLSPSVVAVGGGTARSQTMTLDWTLGESVVETGNTPDRLYTQGFHQPMLVVSEQPNQLSLTGSDAAYQFTVAPNPVVSSLTIAVSAPESSPLELRLIDLKGRQYDLPVMPANSASTQVDMTSFPAGMYVLHISKAQGRLLKTYKILKAQ